MITAGLCGVILNLLFWQLAGEKTLGSLAGGISLTLSGCLVIILDKIIKNIYVTLLLCGLIFFLGAFLFWNTYIDLIHLDIGFVLLSQGVLMFLWTAIVPLINLIGKIYFRRSDSS